MKNKNKDFANKITIKMTSNLSKVIEVQEYTLDDLTIIINDLKNEQKEKYKFNADRLRNLLPRNLDDKGREDYVVKAVEFYNNHQRKKQMER